MAAFAPGFDMPKHRAQACFFGRGWARAQTANWVGRSLGVTLKYLLKNKSLPGAQVLPKRSKVGHVPKNALGHPPIRVPSWAWAGKRWVIPNKKGEQVMG